MNNINAQLSLLNRRNFIKAAAMTAGTAAFSSSAVVAIAQTTARSDDDPVASTQPLATTAYGRVRGYTVSGVHTFKNILYGASTAGKGRFMPPTKPDGWTNVRNTLMFGHVCPSGPGGGIYAGPPEDALLLYRGRNYYPRSENCLCLNVWTKGLKDNAKRPVMVFLHGGGFTSGAASDLFCYEGENLARRGDVVVVTINHRLNVLGFLNLAAYGPQFAMSANVGMLDIVASLEWVQDNIVEFGGDPDNVTVFGQSGGAGKVNALMAMPSAKGRFHKAILMSGFSGRGSAPDASAAVAAQLLAKLSIGPNEVERIQTVSIDDLYTAARGLRGWGPVADGTIIPTPIFNPDPPALAANVPMMMGTCQNESVNGVDNPRVETFSETELMASARGRFGDRAEAIVEAYRKEYSTDKPFALWAAISAAGARSGANTQCERKATQPAGVYQYMFAWRTPVLGGRPGTFHSCDIAFAFNNADKCANQTGGGPRAIAVSHKLSDAFVAFARTGDPNHPGLPNWPNFTAAGHETMVFDDRCAVKAPEREGLRLIAEAEPLGGRGGRL